MPRYCINCQRVTMYSCAYVQGWMVEQLYGYTVLVGYTVPTPLGFLNAAPVPVLNPLTEIRYFQLLQQILQHHPHTTSPPKNQKTKTPT